MPGLCSVGCFGQGEREGGVVRLERRRGGGGGIVCVYMCVSGWCVVPHCGIWYF
jgi:hypothetical protein